MNKEPFGITGKKTRVVHLNSVPPDVRRFLYEKYPNGFMLVGWNKTGVGEISQYHPAEMSAYATRQLISDALVHADDISEEDSDEGPDDD